MSGIFGHLNISDADYVMNTTVGQDVIWTTVEEYLRRWNEELKKASAVFIQEDTEGYKERYKLPGGGHLQRRGPDGSYGAVKGYGEWDVAYPLEDFGAQVAGNDVAMAYMTVAELDRHISTVTIQGINTFRFELLKRLLNNTQLSFTDENHGSLNVEPLANGDSVVYPPVNGSETEATEDHYLESGYAASGISDTNNPYATIVADLEHHFAPEQGGSQIVTFINTAEVAKTEDLTDFNEVPERFIRPGSDSDIPVGFPANLPGKVIGRVSGTWVAVWDFIPANYMVAIKMDAPAPLKVRVDPAATGLLRGLNLISTDEEFPFQAGFWRWRFGVGCGNRLNGVVMELGTGGTYTIPTAYA